MDFDRLMGVIPREFAITGELDGVDVTWFSDESRYKFVVLNETIVIAPLNAHALVYGMYMTREMSIVDARKYLNPLERYIYMNQEEYRWQLQGAGNIAHDGTIIQWTSEGFRVETPIELRPVIEEVIAKLFLDGTLKR